MTLPHPIALAHICLCNGPNYGSSPLRLFLTPRFHLFLKKSITYKPSLMPCLDVSKKDFFCIFVECHRCSVQAALCKTVIYLTEAVNDNSLRFVSSHCIPTVLRFLDMRLYHHRIEGKSARHGKDRRQNCIHFFFSRPGQNSSRLSHKYSSFFLSSSNSTTSCFRTMLSLTPATTAEPRSDLFGFLLVTLIFSDLRIYETYLVS